MSTNGAVGPDGAIQMPNANIRADWSMLGAWTILEDGEAVGQHVVYTQPGVIQYYLENKTFPDGAVLVKELLEAKTGEYNTGTAAYATNVSGWFVMVKDQNDRFSGNDLWGDGWGWAYFDVDDRERTTTEDYSGECLGCHVPAEETDWVYVEAYPALSAPQQ